MHGLMRSGHVFHTGTVCAFAVAARMTGDTLALMINRHRLTTGLDFNRLLHQMMGYRVIVFVIFNVVIDMHACLLNLGVLVGLSGQGAQQWFVQLLELAQS